MPKLFPQQTHTLVSQFEKLDVRYCNLLRRMIRGGFKIWYKLINEKVHVICCTSDVSNFIWKQQKGYAGLIIRIPIEHCEKQQMFNDDKYHRIGRVTPPLLEQGWSLVIPLSIILLTILWNTDFEILKFDCKL